MHTEFSKVDTASQTRLALINSKTKTKWWKSYCIHKQMERIISKKCRKTSEHCRDKLKIVLFSWYLANKKIANQVMRKHPKTMAHAFKIANQEETELLLIDGLAKETTNPIAEINNNNTTSPKHCSIHNSKSNNIVKCTLHLQRSKPQNSLFQLWIQPFSKRLFQTKENYYRTITKFKTRSNEQATFSTNTNIPLDIWTTWINN